MTARKIWSALPLPRKLLAIVSSHNNGHPAVALLFTDEPGSSALAQGLLLPHR